MKDMNVKCTIFTICAYRIFGRTKLIYRYCFPYFIFLLSILCCCCRCYSSLHSISLKANARCPHIKLSHLLLADSFERKTTNSKQVCNSLVRVMFFSSSSSVVRLFGRSKLICSLVERFSSFVVSVVVKGLWHKMPTQFLNNNKKTREEKKNGNIYIDRKPSVTLIPQLFIAQFTKMFIYFPFFF